MRTKSLLQNLKDEEQLLRDTWQGNVFHVGVACVCPGQCGDQRRALVDTGIRLAEDSAPLSYFSQLVSQFAYSTL